MKYKITTLLFLGLLLSTTSYAQIKVIENGNVGIGTITPTEKLDINGKLKIRDVSTASDSWILTYDSVSQSVTKTAIDEIDGSTTNEIQQHEWDGETNQLSLAGALNRTINRFSRVGINGTPTSIAPLYIAGYEPSVPISGTKYTIGNWINQNKCDIQGIDNGYRMGSHVNSAINDSRFTGTLDKQVGLSLHYGDLGTGSGAHINKSIGLYLSFKKTNATYGEIYGIKQTGTLPVNLFEGKLQVLNVPNDQSLDRFWVEDNSGNLFYRTLPADILDGDDVGISVEIDGSTTNEIQQHEWDGETNQLSLAGALNRTINRFSRVGINGTPTSIAPLYIAGYEPSVPISGTKYAIGNWINQNKCDVQGIDNGYRLGSQVNSAINDSRFTGTLDKQVGLSLNYGDLGTGSGAHINKSIGLSLSFKKTNATYGEIYGIKQTGALPVNLFEGKLQVLNVPNDQSLDRFWVEDNSGNLFYRTLPADILDGDDVGLTSEVDGSITNELQTLSQNTTEGKITLSGNGSFVDLTELVQDQVGQMISGNTESGISVTYDDAANELDFVVTNNTMAYRLITSSVTATSSDHVFVVNTDNNVTINLPVGPDFDGKVFKISKYDHSSSDVRILAAGTGMITDFTMGGTSTLSISLICNGSGYYTIDID